MSVEIESPEAVSRETRAKQATRNYMWWAMGAGLIPFPFADLLAVTAVQLKLVEEVAGLYEIRYSENRGKAIIASLIGSLVASTIARGSIGSLLKLVPVVGTFIGAVSMPIFAGATTYAVGRVFIMHFEAGGTLLDFDPARMNQYFQDQFEEGQQVASHMQEKKGSDAARLPKI
jgi:uncharacterized protein (DUF697 family)